MPEQRITDALQKHWEEVKGDRKFPEESDISPDAIEDIWSNCFLAKSEGGKFVYSYLGKSIVEAYGDNLEGEEIVEHELYPESPEVNSKFEEVAKTGEPIKFEGAFINRNNMDIKFRKVLLPLGKDGKVEYIIGGMRWRAF